MEQPAEGKEAGQREVPPLPINSNPNCREASTAATNEASAGPMDEFPLPKESHWQGDSSKKPHQHSYKAVLQSDRSHQQQQSSRKGSETRSTSVNKRGQLIDPYTIKRLSTNIQVLEPSIFQQIVQQLPSVPAILPPGRCLKRFQVDPEILGLRTEELKQVGVILYTPGLSPSCDSIEKWVQSEMSNKLNVTIRQIRVLA
jgi:hypothetical protein